MSSIETYCCWRRCHDQDQPLSFWKLANVEQTITGEAVLRLSAKNGRTTILQRPLQLLYPLEINNRDSENVREVTEIESESKNTNTGDDGIVTQPELRDVRTEQEPTLRR